MVSAIEAVADYAAAVSLGATLPAACTPIEHIVSGFLFHAEEEVRNAALIALGGREAVLSSHQKVGLLVDAFNAGFADGLTTYQNHHTATDATTAEPITGAVAVSTKTSYVAVKMVTRSRARVATITPVETGRRSHLHRATRHN